MIRKWLAQSFIRLSAWIATPAVLIQIYAEEIDRMQLE